MYTTYLETQIRLPDGRSAQIRPLQHDDEMALGTFFLSLSQDTRRRYGPHPFNHETAQQLCAMANPEDPDRFVAVAHDGRSLEIIGYMILSPNIWQSDLDRYGDTAPWATTVCLAPAIADAYQSQGIGTPMGQHLMRCARQMGKTHVTLMGGVQAGNERARRFYTKLGFVEVGEFWTDYGTHMLNYDMILDLSTITY